ncbi:MAG: hypothetical protein KKA90_01300 [Nanoarchaeota archaeon]|nr:hypothetical protein [Nanoarchaeota archaeon]
MHGKATEKIPGGKLLRVAADFGNTITNVEITGDFFLYPEDGLPHLEASLIGVSLPIDEHTVTKILDTVVKQHKLQLLGITPDAIAHCLKAATEEAHG